jgi:hypothetical protein
VLSLRRCDPFKTWGEKRMKTAVIALLLAGCNQVCDQPSVFVFKNDRLQQIPVCHQEKP